MARRGENIRKRKDGRWEGRYTEYAAGIRKTRSVYAKTYKEVREKLLSAKKSSASGSIKEEGILTEESRQINISQLAYLWLDDVLQNRKYSTYIKYRNICNKHIIPAMGKLTLHNLSSNSVADALSNEVSESIQKSIYCVLNQMMFFGSEHYGIKIVPINKKKAILKNDPVKILNISEQGALLRFLYQDMDYSKLGILICLSTGLRLGEICALQWSDIDMESKILHVSRAVQRISCENKNYKTQLIESTPKTVCSKREIPLSENLYILLKKYVNNDKYVVNGDCPMEPRTYQKRFHSYLKKAGIQGTHFHTLRHPYVKPKTKKFAYFSQFSFRPRNCSLSSLSAAAKNACSFSFSSGNRHPKVLPPILQ